MNQQILIDIVTFSLMSLIKIAAPPLIMGLSVGLLVSVFQAVTSIQEPTLAFVPKILAVLFSLLIFGPFMISNIENLFYELYNNLPYYITPR